jgi:hypothetical protein
MYIKIKIPDIKIPKLSLPQIIVLFLVMLNIGFAFYFIKPHFFEQVRKFTSINWETYDYPEIDEIKGSGWDFQKISRFFKELAVKKGGQYAWHSLVYAAQNNYIPDNVDGHLLGHVVGDEMYKQVGIEGIKICTDDMRNACSHSIVVGALLEGGIEILPKAVEVCRQAPGGLGAYTMCIHGLGHGVLAYTNYDMRQAVDFCGRTGTPEYNDQEVSQCIGGVSMEMMAGIHDRDAWMKQAPNYFKNDDPLAPCNSGFIPEKSLSFCYVYLTPHLFQAAGIDLAHPDPKFFNKAMSFCLKLPKSDRNRKTCLESFGKEFIVLANGRNVQSVVSMTDDQLMTVYKWCRLGPQEGLDPCLISAVTSLYWGGENDREVSIRFCSIIPEKDSSKACFDSLIKMVDFFIRNDRNYKESFCKEVPAEIEKNCRERLGI